MKKQKNYDNIIKKCRKNYFYFEQMIQEKQRLELQFIVLSVYYNSVRAGWRVWRSY